VSARVIDRGPYASGREFDLTGATKARLGFGSTGTVLSSR
jgi:rare lipoprotein A